MSQTVIDKSDELNFMDDNQTYNNEVVLSYLDTDLLRDNLREQITHIDELDTGNNTVYNSFNYIESFKEKYDYVLDSIDSDDIDLIQRVNDSRENIYNDIIELIKDKFGLEFTFNFSLSDEEIRIYTESLYKFFIININNTIASYIINRILIDKKNIIKSMKKSVNKKDINYSMIRKAVGNPDDAVVVYNIENYIDSIDITTIEEFIETAIDGIEEEEYISDMRDMFLDEMNPALSDVSCNTDIIERIIKNMIDQNMSILLNIRTELVERLNNNNKK